MLTFVSLLVVDIAMVLIINFIVVTVGIIVFLILPSSCFHFFPVLSIFSKLLLLLGIVLSPRIFLSQVILLLVVAFA